MAKNDKLILTDGQYGLSKEATGSRTGAKLTAMGLVSSQTAAAYSPRVNGEQVQLDDMIAEISDASVSVAQNKMAGVETMLVSQMIALDAMFNNLAQRACKAEHMNNMETFTKLALKAQAQARCTAEAIVMMKNPQPYIRQTNIAQGHQQVNNTYASTSVCNDADTFRTPTRTGEQAESVKFNTSKSSLVCAHRRTGGKSEVMQSKLLGDDNARMDTRTQSQTGGTNQGMEAVGTQHGRKDTRR